MSRSLLERLRADEAVIGCMVTTPSTEVTRAVAVAGTDFVLFDAEHGAIGQHSVLDLVMATAGTNCHPLVRVPSAGPALAKPALDVGAMGIAFPHVCTVNDARELVACTKYPPTGQRGVGPAHAMRRWNMTLVQYLAFARENTLAVAIIESAISPPALGDILAVPGLDVVLVAREDLAASMGHLGDAGHPDVTHVVERMEREILAAGLPLGCRAQPDDDVADLITRGYRFIVAGSDLQLLADAVRSRLSSHRTTPQSIRSSVTAPD